VPRLVRAGYEVVALSRGERSPYHEAPEWRAVQRVSADRDAEDAAGTFGDRGLAAGAAGWFGRQPALDLVDWTDFEERVGSAHAGVTRDHIERSIAASVDRSRSVLGYAARSSSLEAMRESLSWLADNDQIDVGDKHSDAEWLLIDEPDLRSRRLRARS
jgi:hypothetical protein